MPRRAKRSSCQALLLRAIGWVPTHRRVTVDHEFDTAARSNPGGTPGRDPARTMPSRSPTPAARHAGRSVAMWLHCGCERTPHLCLPVHGRRRRVRPRAELPALPGPVCRAIIVGLRDTCPLVVTGRGQPIAVGGPISTIGTTLIRTRKITTPTSAKGSSRSRPRTPPAAAAGWPG
jgi:hypothetical protein